MEILDFKREFQALLDKALDEKFTEYNRYIQDEEILGLIKHTKPIISGGKCIRPYLGYMMYQTLGGQNPALIMDMLVSLELFHAFALIHDDIIDEGKTRHRVSTMHVFVSKRVEKNKMVKNPTHYGHSQAILIGDLLLAWSVARFQQFQTVPYYSQAWQLFYQMIDEVAIGQMLDVNLMTRQETSLDLIETKMRLKTAGYSFVRPMQIGCSLVGKQPSLDQFCLSFGTALGLAFQTQDDILDILANPDILKKSVLSDIKDHQHTFLTQYVLEKGSQQDKEELNLFWGQDFSDTDQKLIVNIFERSGALDYARTKVDEYLARAQQVCAEEKGITEQTRQYLQQLIAYIQKRGY